MFGVMLRAQIKDSGMVPPKSLQDRMHEQPRFQPHKQTLTKGWDRSPEHHQAWLNDVLQVVEGSVEDITEGEGNRSAGHFWRPPCHV